MFKITFSSPDQRSPRTVLDGPMGCGPKIIVCVAYTSVVSPEFLSCAQNAPVEVQRILFNTSSLPLISCNLKFRFPNKFSRSGLFFTAIFQTSGLAVVDVTGVQDRRKKRDRNEPMIRPRL